MTKSIQKVSLVSFLSLALVFGLGVISASAATIDTSAGASVDSSVSATSTSNTKVTYDFGTKILKNGSKGDAVKELQKFLNAKLDLGLKIDGVLGPKTIAVIKKWQKDNGLKADGLIGSKTKAKMNSEA